MGADGTDQKIRMLNIQNAGWGSRQDWYQDNLVSSQPNPGTITPPRGDDYNGFMIILYANYGNVFYVNSVHQHFFLKFYRFSIFKNVYCINIIWLSCLSCVH